MTTLGYHAFLKGLPTHVTLPATIRLKFHQPHRWLLQAYDQDRRVHYEVQRIPHRGDFEVGLHFESRNKGLNSHMLKQFLRRMFEIHAELGESVVAEQWDKGWTKLYEVVSAEPLTADFQAELGRRITRFITCIHPILQQLYDTPVRRREFR